jgi:CubicO group peptidase (beta-lactamase class C family)
VAPASEMTVRRAIAPCLLLLLWVPTAAAAQPWPSPDWPSAPPADEGMDETTLGAARDYALTGNGSGYVVRNGVLVMSWGSDSTRYDLKSSTKSIGVTSLGLAIMDGHIALDDLATAHHPSFGVPPDSNADTGWLPRITIFHLATQTAGFDKNGGYTALLFEAGTRWSYSDGGPNWLAECITLAYHRDLSELLFERVFTPLGIGPDDLRWRTNSYRNPTLDGVARREFGSGISADVDAMARIGYLYLRRGMWEGTRILPASFVDRARRPQAELEGLPVELPGDYFDASDHYGLLWWNNGDGTLAGVPTDAYWSWGLYDSLIVVIPSLDLVVARAGDGWRSGWNGDYAALEPFLGPIVASVDPSTIPPDAGVDPDAGPVADAGPPPDAASRLDSGRASDAGGATGSGTDGGCGCSIPGVPKPDAAPLLLLLGPLLLRRRARREGPSRPALATRVARPHTPLRCRSADPPRP